MNDILDLHTHTIASGHAYNTLFEMFEAAYQKGLALFGSSDHAPRIPGTCTQMYFNNFSVIPRTYKDMPIMMGSELNILDYNGSVDLPEYTLKRMDYAIASIHKPCYHCGTPAENTSAIIGALKNPYIKIIGHPDDGRFPLEFAPIVEAAKSFHKLLEVNSSSLVPGCSRINARENYLKLLPLCAEAGVSVILSSDAHVANDVGNHRLAHELLEEIHFPEELVVNTSLEKVAAYIPTVATLLH